jgi:hypothetical protein
MIGFQVPLKAVCSCTMRALSQLSCMMQCMRVFTKILFQIFLWSGSKLFSSVSIYAPDGEDGDVLAVHFGVNEQAIIRSCREMAENSLA